MQDKLDKIYENIKHENELFEVKKKYDVELSKVRVNYDSLIEDLLLNTSFLSTFDYSFNRRDLKNDNFSIVSLKNVLSLKNKYFLCHIKNTEIHINNRIQIYGNISALTALIKEFNLNVDLASTLDEIEKERDRAESAIIFFKGLL